jgi:hypothetical protein
MKPLVEGIEKNSNGKYEVRQLNVSGNDQAANALADKMGVQYVPTFAFVNSNGIVSKTVVGAMTQEALASAVGSLK